MKHSASDHNSRFHWPLELNDEEFRDLAAYITEKIVHYVETLPRQALSDHDGIEDLIADLAEPIPRASEFSKKLIDCIFDNAATKGYNSASPGYMAFIPGGGLIHTGLADLIADAINRYVGVWMSAPGLVQIETNVIRWFCEIVGFPETAGGFLTTGGSLANFSALFTARRNKLPDQFLLGTLYTSDQSHHSVLKAAILAGFPRENVKTIPTGADYRIKTDSLTEQIRRDRLDGMQPFVVIANAGTTNTGAIDDLDRIADIAERERLWFHIDAAYGGFFMITQRGRQVMRGIERADSITLDPHKGLFLSYGTGCLIVRDRNLLQHAHAIDADYLPPMQNNPERVDFCQISPELSRDFRGLRVWLPLKMHGIPAFAEALDEKLDLITEITAKLERIPQIEIVAKPQLSVVAFKVRAGKNDNAAENQLTRKLLIRINEYRRVLLTGTCLDDRFVIRICILSFRTHLDHVIQCCEDIERACNEVLGSPQSNR